MPHLQTKYALSLDASANINEIISGETLPAATGVVSHAVSFTKGCYPGQELVERMDSRGSTAPKTLRLLQGDSTLGAVAGGPIIVDGVEVGVFTSVGEGDALGYVARAVDIGVLVGSANDSGA
jgi:folate-binding protein YgfZ